MIQVIDGQITAYSLPRVGKLTSGETVSGYHLLPKATLKEEGWLPLEDIRPEYDEETQYLQTDGYEILKTKAKKKYKVEDIPELESDEGGRLEKAMFSTMRILQKGIEPETMVTSELNEIIFVFDPYKQDAEYKAGDYVEHHGELYKCQKDHTSDYQLMPNTDDGSYWEKVDGKGKEIEESKVDFYYRDETYEKGALVTYYGTIYRSKEKQSGKDPESYPESWEKL